MISKYGAKRVEFNGEVFDSKFELTYWLYLQELVKQNKIKNLQRQVKYILLPRQTDDKGKFKFHPVIYKSDFEYDDCEQTHHTVDTKGFRTADFRIKQKLFYYRTNREIECVTYKEAKKDELFAEIDKNMKNYFKCNGV